MARFENIKVGDKIICTKSGYGSSYSRVATVKKVNKVSFVCEFDNITITFNFNGTERGASGWVHWYCDEYTYEKADKIYKENRKASIASKLSKTNFNELPLDTLEKIYEIIEKNKFA